MKKILITAITTALIMLMLPISAIGRSFPSLAVLRKVRKREGLVRVLDGKDMASRKVDRILNGNGDLVIEISYGVVLNAKGDGRLINTSSKRYNYISYRKVKGVRKGDVVMSVFIYSPDRKGADDIADRYDWIVDR